jgi:hypothetical protein
MAELERATLAELFPEDTDFGPAMADAEARPDASGVVRAASLIPWDLVGGPAWDALRGLLDRDPVALLGECWAQAETFRAYADPAKYPPDQTIVAHLAEHEFCRDLHPVINVSIAGCPPVELRFTVALEAWFSGVALSIRGGHIRSGRLGDATLSAELKYREISLIPEQKTRKLKLPGRFSFREPGLRIPPPEHAAS